jgi:hypothetical protein
MPSLLLPSCACRPLRLAPAGRRTNLNGASTDACPSSSAADEPGRPLPFSSCNRQFHNSSISVARRPDLPLVRSVATAPFAFSNSARTGLASNLASTAADADLGLPYRASPLSTASGRPAMSSGGEGLAWVAASC